jgi:hypothetical protein
MVERAPAARRALLRILARTGATRDMIDYVCRVLDNEPEEEEE